MGSEMCIRDSPHEPTRPRVRRTPGSRKGDPFERLLLLLLEQNRHNRMAFEFLMWYYLLKRQPEKVVANLHRLDDFHYKGIPKHLEEAFLLYVLKYKVKDRSLLHGRQIRRETVTRLRQASRDSNRYEHAKGPEAQIALDALVRDAGDTYFFYAQFGTSEPWPGWRKLKPQRETRPGDAFTGATR